MKRLLWLGVPLLLAAAPQQDSPKPYALATLTVRQGGTRGADGVLSGGTFMPVDHFDVPADHISKDTLIAFEGPGWESDKIAYRLYLDERNVPDIYGKKLPGPVLGRIGQGKDDYHDMADWGMDILQVGPSLGAGGVGVLRDGKVTQLGPSAKIAASIANLPGVASVRVEDHGFAGAGGPADLVATYSIAAGSRLTHVEARVAGAVPSMVAGIVHHPGTEVVSEERVNWRYAGSWGKQSLAGDSLGMALFYRIDQADMATVDSNNIAATFCHPAYFDYWFGATWAGEPGAPKTLPQFRAWLDATVRELDRIDKRPIMGPCSTKIRITLEAPQKRAGE